VAVDHSTLHHWVLKYVPALETALLARKRPVGGSWQLDETYVRDTNLLGCRLFSDHEGGLAGPAAEIERQITD
jgi:hypothetical protein